MPDGGYGWVIVLSAFVNFTLVGGNFMGFSLLYHSIAESMQATYAATGWVGSLSQGIMHISGRHMGAEPPTLKNVDTSSGCRSKNRWRAEGASEEICGFFCDILD